MANGDLELALDQGRFSVVARDGITLISQDTVRVLSAKLKLNVVEMVAALERTSIAGRYLENLRAALTGGQPSYAWSHYYYLADHPDVSRTRAVVVAMIIMTARVRYILE